MHKGGNKKKKSRSRHTPLGRGEGRNGRTHAQDKIQRASVKRMSALKRMRSIKQKSRGIQKLGSRGREYFEGWRIFHLERSDNPTESNHLIVNNNLIVLTFDCHRIAGLPHDETRRASTLSCRCIERPWRSCIPACT